MSRHVRTVLVVDDEAGQRKLMKCILGLKCYAVIEAADYQEALAAQQQHRGEVDLILLDLALPGGTGYDLCQAMLAVEPRLKVLFTSAQSGAELCKFRDPPPAGLHFLPKPFTPAELLNAVGVLFADVRSRSGSASGGASA